MKDLSDLYTAAVGSGQPEMFKKTVEVIVWRARLRQRERKHLSSTSAGNVKVDDTSLASFGAIRFASLGDPQPPQYLVRDCIEVGEPTYLYGGPGTLKSIKATALAISIASPEVSEI